MYKINMYRDLVRLVIFHKTDVENTKVFENDVVIDDEYINLNGAARKYKVETDNMTNEEIIIALLAKQNLQLKTIKNILIFAFVFIVLNILGIVGLSNSLMR